MSNPKRGPIGRMSNTANRTLLRSTSRVAPMMFGTTAVNGGIAIITARGLGAGGRGELALIVAVISATTLLTSIGVNTAGRYHLVSTADFIDLSDYLGLTAILMAIETLISMAVTWCTFEIIGADLSIVGLFISGAYGAAFLAALQCRDAVNAFGFTTQASAISGIGSVVTGILTISLMFSGSTSVIMYAASVGLGSAVEFCTHLAYLKHHGHSIHLQFRIEPSLRLLRRGAPALGLNAGQSLTFRLDRFVIGFLLGPAAVGIYVVAAAVSELLRLVPAAFGQVAFFRSALGTLQPGELMRARRLLLLAMIPPLLLLAWFAPVLITFAFGSEFEGAVTPTRLLLIGELAIMSFQIDSRVLSGIGATTVAGISGMIGLTSVLVLDLMFIPPFGLIGAAWASVFAYIAMGASAWIFVLRHERKRGSATPHSTLPHES